jgi:hypothetical protein
LQPIKYIISDKLIRVSNWQSFMDSVSSMLLINQI